MRLYAPTNIYIEKNCVSSHSQELTALGTRAFIVTGRHSSSANGSLADVTDVLEAANIPYDIYNEVEENPSVETTVKAAAAGKAFGGDFVIGIGGGSPLDAAKAIALLMANPQETADCLYTARPLKALPIAAVPTTCGTGSEVTPNAVLTLHALKTKKSISYKLYPDLALVDGKYLRYAGRKLLTHTAADALAHCVESRLHARADVSNHMFSEYGLQLWSSIVPYLRGEKEPDEKAYELLMLTSTVAGLAIAQTATSIPHALSYEITYHYGVPHGKACGLFLAAYMKEYAKNKPEDVVRVLDILGFTSTDSFGLFLTELLGRESVSGGDIPAFTENMMRNRGKLSTYPFHISEETIRNILHESLDIH